MDVNNCEKRIKTKKANHFYDSLIGRFVEARHCLASTVYGWLRNVY